MGLPVRIAGVVLAVVACVVAFQLVAAWVGQPPPSVIARATFGRTFGPGWGDADRGGPFRVSGTKSDYQVLEGSGQVLVPAPGLTRRALLRDVVARDVDLSFRVTIRSGLVGSGAFVYGLLRSVETVGEYRTKIRFAPTGSVYVAVTTVEAGAETPVGEEVRVPDFQYVSGATIHVRTRIEGAAPARLSAKVWAAGDREPPGWLVSEEATVAAVDEGGAVGVQAYASRFATDAPVELRFDDVEVRTIEPEETQSEGVTL